MDRQPQGRDILYIINLACSILSGAPFRELGEASEHVPLRDVLRPWRYGSDRSLKKAKKLNGGNLPIPRQFLGIMDTALGIEVRAWKSQLEPWSAFIEPARQLCGEQVVFWLTAIRAAATVNLTTARECRLTDQRETLCDRAAYAKQRSDDSDWWREQLASASNIGTSAVQYVVLAMQQFSPIELIFTLSGEVSSALDRLPDSAWHRLARASSNLEVPIKNIGSVGLPSSASPRLAALLIDRFSPDEGLLIYERFLVGYNGSDRSVLQKCADLAFRGLRNPEMREESLQIISNVYKQDICPQVAHRHLHLEKENEIPTDVAYKICSSPTDYPLSLIAAAETVLTTQAGSRSIPVGEVAARDRWFVDQ